MTTFRFRGKRKDNGEWVEGNLVLICDGDTLKRYPCIVISYNHDTFDYISVLPSTVGLISSMPDSTGKLIAQGDNVRVNWFIPEVVLICDFDGVSFNLNTKYANLRLDNFKPSDLTIVGTIHD